MSDDSDSGMNNPIFDIMKRERPTFKSVFSPFYHEEIYPPPSPYLSDLKFQYSDEIDKMRLTLNDFNNNILQMMEATNRMIEIIDLNSEINIIFDYKEKTYPIKCKLNDKLSDVIDKIKIDEGEFDKNNKMFLFFGKALNLNTKLRDEKIKNFDIIYIADI